MPGKLSADSCALSVSIQGWKSAEFLDRQSRAAAMKFREKYLLMLGRTGQLGDDVSLKKLPFFSIWVHLGKATSF